MKKLLLFCCLLACFPSVAQNRQLTGTVLDATTNQPIVSATINVQNSTVSAATDAAGRFTLNVPSGPLTLDVSFVGYTTKAVAVAADETNVTITLTQGGGQLSEVVVTALGIRKERRRLGYSVTEIKGEELAATKEINPINALQGKVAGVQIDQGSGGIAGNARILIRGNSTLSVNNQPLFIIDGVFMDNDAFSGQGRDFGNDLKNLNMEDFESVSVLKGSAAAALYGSRAINGVILITTKKGRQRKGIGVTVSQTVNIQHAYRGPDFQNEYGGGTVGAFFTDTRDPGYKPDQNWETKVFPTNSAGQPYIDPQINRELENWGPRFANQNVINYDGTMTQYKAVPNNYLDAFQTGKLSITSVALDGGSDKYTFRLGYTLNKSEGINFRNEFAKNAFSLRTTYNLTSFLTADAGADFSFTQTENPPLLGLNNFIWIFPRNYDTKYWMRRDKYTSKLGGLPKPFDPAETNRVPGADYWFRMFENDYIQREQMMRGRLTLTATLTPWARFMVEGNFQNLYIKNELKELGTGYNFSGEDNGSGGRYGLGHSAKENRFLKAILMLNRTFNSDWDVSGYIGTETQRFSQSFNYQETAGGLIFPGNYFLSNSRRPGAGSGGISTRKTFNSVYASADVSFRNQVYLQTTWRGDWSSALTYADGTGNNFFNYPAASLSWIFSETLKLPRWLSFAKLRTNVAALGGDLDPFIINPGFVLNGFSEAQGSNYPMLSYLRDETGQTFVVDRNIKPLRKISKEIGLEVRLFNNRAGFDLSLYRDNTRNQAIKIPAPVETGVNSLLVNAGNIQNQGIELSLNGTPVQTKNFNWNTTLIFSNNRNKIIELYGDREYYALQSEGDASNDQIPYAKVGGAYGVIRTRIHSKKYQAVDASGKPIDHPNNGQVVLNWRSDARAAFPKRSNELQDVGDINAKFRTSWDNTLRYKAISLNILLDAKIGGDMVVTSVRYGTHTGIYKSSLQGRDAAHGGIVWTSKYDGKTYDDGILPEGIFDNGQTITQPDGTQVDVSGMSFREAYEKGYVEPTHLPQFMYRYGSFSTAVGDYWVVENSWVSLRQVALNFNLPQKWVSKLRLNDVGVSLIGRDLIYLYNSLPNNINPASNNSNRTSVNKEEGFIPPMTRTVGITIRAGF